MLSALLSSGPALFISCSEDGEDPVQITLTPQLPDAKVTKTVRYDEAKMTAYNFEYPSTDPYGQPVTLSGTITIGDEVTNNHARGLLLYNHFTVYRADQCPSCGDLQVQAMVVGSGLITISPDYYGFGVTESKPQAYCIPSANARAGIDAVLAARKLLPDLGYTWDDFLFNAGYSQGGQTTVAVVKLATEEYPDIRFTRSFAGGGPYSIAETYKQFISSGRSAMPSTVVGVLQSYNDVFGLNIARGDIFLEPLLSNLDEWLLSKRYAQTQLERYIGSEKLADFIQPALLDLNSDLSRRFMDAFEKEDLCKGWQPRKDEQLTIVHNLSDDAVPGVNAEKLIEFLRSQGLTITQDSSARGVYDRTGTFGYIPGVVDAHQLGSMIFLSTVVGQISNALGIEYWYTPDFSLFT